MIGPDEKEYSVPANYASKSKLVEGDTLKLTIQADGSFLFKQIKPIDRERKTGKLLLDEITGQFSVLAEDKKYNVLPASVTFFKGEAGDSITILTPKNRIAQWGAIENIIKNGNEQDEKTLSSPPKETEIIKKSTAEILPKPEEKNTDKKESKNNLLDMQDLVDL